MKNLLFLSFLLFSSPASWAETSLSFPTTADEFVQALTPKPPDSTRQRKGLGGDEKGVKAIVEDNPAVGILIQFESDSVVIKAKLNPTLRELAKALQGGLAEAQFVVAGHTDNRGSREYNLGLAEHRAQAVKDFLVTTYGIAPQRLCVVSYGKELPLADNATEKGRALNRRVEIVRQECKR